MGWGLMLGSARGWRHEQVQPCVVALTLSSQHISQQQPRRQCPTLNRVSEGVADPWVWPSSKSAIFLACCRVALRCEGGKEGGVQLTFHRVRTQGPHQHTICCCCVAGEGRGRRSQHSKLDGRYCCRAQQMVFFTRPQISDSSSQVVSVSCVSLTIF